MVVYAVAGLLASYIVGSIPFGWLLGRLAGVDVRAHGSGNIGATNVWRVCGWKWGLPAFALDVAKGAVPVLWIAPFAAVQTWGEPFVDIYGHDPTTGAMNAVHSGATEGRVLWLAIGCAVCAVVGHNFPVWLKFKGGKGVATSAGAMLALMPVPCVAGLAAFAAVVAWKRYISLGSMTAALVFAVVASVREPWPLVLCAWLLAALLVYRHRANLARLRAGTESKFGARAAPATATPTEKEEQP